MTTSPLVPAQYDVAINGRPYLVDFGSQRFAGPVSLKVNRTQADTGDRAGENSLARENLWRRTVTSWHHGCGQVHYDGNPSDPYRFNKSLGIDVWTQGQMKPLGGLARRATPAANGGNIATNGTGNHMVLFNGQGYVSGGTNGNSAYLTWDTTSAQFSFANGIISLCTDGSTVYGADAGAGGTGGAIYSWPGTGAAAVYVAAGSYYLTRWALGRLWAADSTGLKNIVAGPTANLIITKPSTNWVYTDVVAGNGGVLVSGYDKSHSTVAFAGLLPDASGVVQGPTIAEMPAGEVIYAMHAYLGYIILGTNKGVRVCQHRGDADFIVGPLIDIFSPDSNAGTRAPSTTGVRCFASTGSYVYFGWSFYDWGGQFNSNENSGTFWGGLGRMDLSVMVNPLQPAYATDVMYKVTNGAGGGGGTPTGPVTQTIKGEITGCVIERGQTPSFVMAGVELVTGNLGGTPTRMNYYNNTGPDPYMRSGKVTLGLDDLKTPASFSMRWSQGEALSLPTLVVVNEQGVTTSNVITATAAAGSDVRTFDAAASAPSEAFELQTTWPSNAAIGNPVGRVFDQRLSAWPAPPRVERWQLPLILRETLDLRDGSTRDNFDGAAEITAIAALGTASTRTAVDFQFGGTTYTNCVIDDWEFIAEASGPGTTGPAGSPAWRGTLVVTLSREVQ